MAVIQQSIWRDFVAEQLVKNNEFLKYVKPVPQANILNGRSVNIPNSGALPTVTVNDATVGGTIGVRTDTVASYDLNWFRTAPVLIDHLDEIELSYDKTASVMKAQTDALAEAVGNYFFYWMLYNGGSTWVPGTDCVVTTGASTGYSDPTHTTARLALTLADILSAGYLMSRQGIPKNDRFCVLPSVMYYQLMTALGVVGNANIETVKGYNNNEGKVMTVAGFNVIDRASVGYTTATSTYTAVAPTAGTWTPANTWEHAGLCFQSECVEFALGDVKLFETKDSAEYYGSIYSGEVRAGGRPVYSGNYGVIPILQKTS